MIRLETWCILSYVYFATPSHFNGVNGRPTAGNRAPIAPAWVPCLGLLPLGYLQGAVIPIMCSVLGQLQDGGLRWGASEPKVACRNSCLGLSTVLTELGLQSPFLSGAGFWVDLEAARF